jgi:hypothetical protein
MGNARGKHLNKDGFLPIGHLCGGLEVASEKKKRTDGKKHNLWGYDCICRFCLTVKWYSYASLSGKCAKSCGCKTREWLSEHARRGRGMNRGRACVPTEVEKEFVRKWTK